MEKGKGSDMTAKNEQALRDDITRIKQAVLGNGMKGLCKTVEEQGEWIAGHPNPCPHVLKRQDIFKVRMLEVAVIAVILTVGQVLLKIFRVI